VPLPTDPIKEPGSAVDPDASARGGEFDGARKYADLGDAEASPERWTSNSPVAEFRRRAPELDEKIVQALDGLGDEAIEAYASVRLYHNTLSGFVPKIMAEGLRPDNEVAVPDEEDLAFAEALFRAKGFYHPDNARQFDVYIAGRRGERERGLFFYGQRADTPVSLHTGYGQPERLRIFAREMAGIVAQTDGPYSAEERQRAHELFEKYAEVVNGGEDGHIAVLRANPFSPAIFNYRLQRLPGVVREHEPDLIMESLKRNGTDEFEGI